MTREVVLEIESDVVLVDNATKDNGYFMAGDKGNYILGRDTSGKFIWVKATPGKVTKPVHTYDTVKEAITDKLSRGYQVFEYSDVDFE